MKRTATSAEEPLDERIRRAEAAIVRRDDEFVRELDAVTAELPRLARRTGAVLLVAAATTAVVALVGRHRSPSVARAGRASASAPAHRMLAKRTGILTVLSMLVSLLPLLSPARRIGERAAVPGSAPVQHIVQLTWPLLQWCLERPGRVRADRHAEPGRSRPAAYPERHR